MVVHISSEPGPLKCMDAGLASLWASTGLADAMTGEDVDTGDDSVLHQMGTDSGWHGWGISICRMKHCTTDKERVQHDRGRVCVCGGVGPLPNICVARGQQLTRQQDGNIQKGRCSPSRL